MKTFLHYTKERELDEGILDSIVKRVSGFAGSATRIMAKAGRAAEISRTALSGFDQGSKPGDIGKGMGAAAGQIVNRAEKSRQESEEDAEQTDIQQIRTVHQRLPRAGRGHPDVYKHQDNINNIALSHRGNPAAKRKAEREYYQKYAEQLRANPTHTKPPNP